MNEPPKIEKAIGIVGSGQLGLMISHAADTLNLTTHFFSQSDPQALLPFSETVDLLIVENEFFDFDALPANQLKCPIFPSLSILKILKNKLKQKKLLLSENIPTAPMMEWDGLEAPEQWLQRVCDQWPQGAVLKWADGGYDGKGVFFLTYNRLPEALSFIQGSAGGTYAEEKISFQQELACIAVRSVIDEVQCYPVVISKQSQGICDEVWGPAIEFGLSPTLQTEIHAVATKLLRGLGYVGAIGVELFQVNDQQWLVNELAPRVHNSGHYSIDGSHCSQFENHLRAVTGMPLGNSAAKSCFMMKNILGPEAFEGEIAASRIPPKKENLSLHWYGKTISRPRRKLGHINILFEKAEEVEKARQTLNQYVGEWEKGF